MKLKIFLLLFFILVFKSVSAQEKKGFSYNFKGLIFGDLYYVKQHHLPEANDIGGAVMRRAYLTFDTKFSGKWYTRFRLEANQSGEYQNYNSTVQLKDLFIGYRTDLVKIVLGLSPTKTFDLIEGIWGVRYLARTPMDIQGSPSREWGLAVDGNISKEKGLKYRTMISHAVEFGGETGDGFRFQGALSWQPDDAWLLDLFGDYEQIEGESDRSTFQVFGGYKTEKIRFGAQYSLQDRQKDPGIELFSVFAIGKVYKNLSAIARIDRLLKPSPRGNDIAYIPFDPTSTATLYIGGFEFPAGKYFTLTPNIIYINYDENDMGITPTSDLNFRMTIFFKID